MTIGNRIKNLRVQRNLSQSELAEMIGTIKQTIYKYETGIITNIPTDKITQLAKIFKVSPAYLMGWDNEEENIFDKYDNLSPIKLKKFPMLGEIACGEPIWANEDRESYVMADMDINADFCLTAKGDSMINARIYDGDIVFIRKMPIVNNGDIAAVIIENEATLKRLYYYPDKNKLILNPENPSFEPLVYTNEELNTIRILGKAVYFMSAL